MKWTNQYTKEKTVDYIGRPIVQCCHIMELQCVRFMDEHRMQHGPFTFSTRRVSLQSFCHAACLYVRAPRADVSLEALRMFVPR